MGTFKDILCALRMGGAYCFSSINHRHTIPSRVSVSSGMRKRADSAFLQVPPLLIAVVRKWRAGTVGGIWQDQIGAKMGSALVTIYFC